MSTNITAKVYNGEMYWILILQENTNHNFLRKQVFSFFVIFFFNVSTQKSESFE